MERQSTREFFDLLGDQYGGAIRRCVPRYTEMLWAVLHYLPADFSPQRILELGCGDGNLSLQVRKRWPQAELHLLDNSTEMLQQCKKRTGAGPVFIQADMNTVQLEPASFDLVISSIAIHHLTDAEKPHLFNNIFQWLRPGGWLSYSDQFRSPTEEAYTRNIELWRQEANKLGATPEDWQRWMEHQQQHDHHATLMQQTGWLTKAGFTSIDCPWRYVLWTVLTAQRPVAD